MMSFLVAGLLLVAAGIASPAGAAAALTADPDDYSRVLSDEWTVSPMTIGPIQIVLVFDPVIGGPLDYSDDASGDGGLPDKSSDLGGDGGKASPYDKD
jgi:hypothetical protein